MKIQKYFVSLAAGLVFALSATGAGAGTVVTAELWDKGGGMTMPMPTGLTYAAPGLDLSKATMGIKLTRDSVPAGDITFQVNNASKDTVHEMIVMYLTSMPKTGWTRTRRVIRVKCLSLIR